MAGQVKLYYVFLLAFYFSLVSCSEDDYFKNVHVEDSFSSSNNVAYERNLSSAISDSYTYDGGSRILFIPIGWIILGIIFVIGLLICCVAICCPFSCCRKERRGYIINSNIPPLHVANIYQPMIPPTVVIQHVPPEAQLSQDPPPYDTQLMQQNFQYPPTEYLQQNPAQPMG